MVTLWAIRFAYSRESPRLYRHQLLVSQRGPALESKLLIPRLGSERPPPSSELAVEMPVP